MLRHAARTPPSFRALTLNRYVAPGRRLLMVHSRSGPWYTSDTTSSGSVISTLYSETGQPLSDGGTSRKKSQNTLVTYGHMPGRLIFYFTYHRNTYIYIYTCVCIDIYMHSKEKHLLDTGIYHVFWKMCIFWQFSVMSMAQVLCKIKVSNGLCALYCGSGFKCHPKSSICSNSRFWEKSYIRSSKMLLLRQYCKGIKKILNHTVVLQYRAAVADEKLRFWLAQTSPAFAL